VEKYGKPRKATDGNNTARVHCMLDKKSTDTRSNLYYLSFSTRPNVTFIRSLPANFKNREVQTRQNKGEVTVCQDFLWVLNLDFYHKIVNMWEQPADQRRIINTHKILISLTA
jgi:hypothetical protein